MHAWMRRSGSSPDNRIGFYDALAAGVVIGAIVFSIALSVQIDRLMRNAHYVSAAFQGPPSVPDSPEEPQAPMTTSPPVAIAVERTPLPIARPPLTEHVVLPPPRPHTLQAAERAPAEPDNIRRQSRSQVARNARNQRRLRDVVDAAVAGSAHAGAGAYALIAEARRHLGTNPTTRARLWCARFMNFVLQRTGHRGTGSDLAMSFAKYGRRIAGPRVGAIAVLRRKGGGHVGIVTAVPGKGRIVLLSGNDGRRVRERIRSTAGVVAYVMPEG